MTEALQTGVEASSVARTPAGDLPMVVVERAEPERLPTLLSRALGLIWRIRFLPLLWALVMLGGIIGLYFQPPGLQLVFRWLGLTPGGGTSTPIAVPVPEIDSPGHGAPVQQVVVGLGKLVPAGDVILVAPPYGSGDARVARLLVREGERVVAGQVLATLDNEAALQAAVETARAAVATREAQLAQTSDSVRASRDEAQAALDRAEAAARNAQLDFERTAKLFKRGISSEATYQQKRTARDETAREVSKARATLSRFQSVEASAQLDVVLAARNLDAAKADLARAMRDLEKARVLAPADGTVLTIHVRSGERPGNEGILNLGNLEDMTAEVEVYQSQIGLVDIGDAVEIAAEALSAPLKGTVTRIGLEVGRQTMTDSTPAANTDARVVKVYVDLDEPSSKLAERFTNLQVMARIQVQVAP